jgi:hypothetical protein
MMHMLMFVLDDQDRLHEVLEAWEAVGVTGATIVESTGFNRERQARQVGANYMAGINRLMGEGEQGHYTLFAIVPDEAAALRCLSSTEAIVGDLDGPNTGVLAAWPLTLVRGVRGSTPRESDR